MCARATGLHVGFEFLGLHFISKKGGCAGDVASSGGVRIPYPFDYTGVPTQLASPEEASYLGMGRQKSSVSWQVL